MVPEKDTYFKIYRKIFDNGIWRNTVELRLFFWLIGHAVFERRIEYDEVVVNRGQYLRSYRKLQEDLEYLDNNKIVQYPLMTIKRAADKLIKKGMLLTADTRLGTLFTVVNYDKYQPKQAKNDSFESIEAQGNKKLDTGHDTSLVQTCYNIKNDKNEKEYNSPNSEEFRLSSLLLNLIKERRSNLKEPNLHKWCEHFNKLIRLDNRTPGEIERVIRWCQRNNFWQNNILSPDKLRKQYDKLAMQMDAELKQTSGTKPIKQSIQTYLSESDRIIS